MDRDKLIRAAARFALSTKRNHNTMFEDMADFAIEQLKCSVCSPQGKSSTIVCLNCGTPASVKTEDDA